MLTMAFAEGPYKEYGMSDTDVRVDHLEKKCQQHEEELAEFRKTITNMRLEHNNAHRDILEVRNNQQQILNARSKTHEAIGRWLERLAWGIITAMAVSWEKVIKVLAGEG